MITATTVRIAAVIGAPFTRSIETLIAAPPGMPPIAAAGIGVDQGVDRERHQHDPETADDR